MLQNEYLVATIGFDAVQNGPSNYNGASKELAESLAAPRGFGDGTAQPRAQRPAQDRTREGGTLNAGPRAACLTSEVAEVRARRWLFAKMMPRGFVLRSPFSFSFYFHPLF